MSVIPLFLLFRRNRQWIPKSEGMLKSILKSSQRNHQNYISLKVFTKKNWRRNFQRICKTNPARDSQRYYQRNGWTSQVFKDFRRNSHNNCQKASQRHYHRNEQRNYRKKFQINCLKMQRSSQRHDRSNFQQ